jgi:hypothetical protein
MLGSVQNPNEICHSFSWRTTYEDDLMTLTADEIRAANERSEVYSTRRYEAERHNNLREFQARADSAYNECGLGAAPRRHAGQSEVQHCVGVLDELLGHVGHLPSLPAAWRRFNPKTLSEQAAVDAIAPNHSQQCRVAAMNATDPGSGPERCIEKRDTAGRTIRSIAGDFDPWRPFRAETRVVSAWNPQGYCKGAKALGAIVPQPVVMSDGSVRAAR